MMERLTIDEVIEHCKKTTSKYESVNTLERLGNADMSNSFIKNYWEHRQVGKWLEELKTYKDAEEQGLILMLPCKVGSTVYVINSRYTKCTREKQEFDEYSCQGCEWLDCDSHKEYYIHTNKSVSLEWIVRYSKEIGKTVFLTKEEAEQALAEMKEV